MTGYFSPHWPTILALSFSTRTIGLPETSRSMRADSATQGPSIPLLDRCDRKRQVGDGGDHRDLERELRLAKVTRLAGTELNAPSDPVLDLDPLSILGPELRCSLFATKRSKGFGLGGDQNRLGIVLGTCALRAKSAPRAVLA